MSSEISIASLAAQEQLGNPVNHIHPKMALRAREASQPTEPAAPPKAASSTTLGASSGNSNKQILEQQRQLREALAELNEQMKKNGRDLNFTHDSVLNTTVVTVKNSQTGEVIRQIPDAAVIRVAHNLEKVKGMLLNEET